MERIPETVPKDPEYPDVEFSNSSEGIPHGPTPQTFDDPSLDLISVWSGEKGEVNKKERAGSTSAISRDEQDSQLIGNLCNKTVTRTWKPSHWTQSTNSLLCSDIMAKLSKLTRCRIQPAPEQRSFVLTGETDEDVERAMSKLIVLVEANVSTRQFQRHRGLPSQYYKDVGVLFFDFQIAEKDFDTRLKFIPLEKDARRLRTTLLSLQSPHTAVLHDLLVLVLLKHDVDHKFVVISDQKLKRLQSLNTHCRIWPLEYEYKPRGHERLMLTNSTLASTSSSGDRSTAHEHVPHSLAAVVERWREEVTAPSGHGVITAATSSQPGFDNGRGSSATESVNVFAKPAMPQRRTYGLKRVPKGIPILETTEQSAHQTELSSVAASGENLPLRPVRAESIGVSPCLRTTAPAASVNVSQPDWLAAVEGNQAHHHSSINAYLPGMPYLIRSPEANNNISSTSARSVASTTLAKGDITPTGPLVLGQPTQPPTRSLGCSEPEDEVVRGGNSIPPWRTRVMHSERTVDLVHNLEAAQRPSNMRSRMPIQAQTPIRRSDIRRPVQQRTGDVGSAKAANERLQASNEVDSRNVKHTMKQQKLATSEGAAKGDAAVAKSFEVAATHMLKLARSCNGIVTLEVDIGRILVRSQDVAQDYRKGLFTADEWPSIFPAGQEAGFRETLFSNM